MGKGAPYQTFMSTRCTSFCTSARSRLHHFVDETIVKLGNLSFGSCLCSFCRYFQQVIMHFVEKFCWIKRIFRHVWKLRVLLGSCFELVMWCFRVFLEWTLKLWSTIQNKKLFEICLLILFSLWNWVIIFCHWNMKHFSTVIYKRSNEFS